MPLIKRQSLRALLFTHMRVMALMHLINTARSHIKLCVKCLVGSSTGLTSFYGSFYCLQLRGSFVSRTKAWKNRRLAHFRPRVSKSSLTVGWQQYWRKAKSFLKPRKVQKKNFPSCRSTAVLFSLIVFVDPGAIGRHAGIVNRSHFQTEKHSV